MIIDLELDTQGLFCPEPIMLIRKNIRSLEVGQTMRILATDPAAIRDIPSFCKFMDHHLISQQVDSLPYCFVLKKGN